VAGFAIALALLIVGAVCVPVRLWASRIRVSSRRTQRRVAPTVDERAGIAGLRACSRDLLTVVSMLEQAAPEYRRTLPYVSLFFADPRQGLHVRRDRWIVAVRQDFETAIEELALQLRSWCSAAQGLDARERMILEAAGGVPRSLRALLRDVVGLPRNTAEARRWRFCEETELDALTRMLDELVDELRRLDLELSSRDASPYR
jgi:hypothetical protein